ncbi:MAG: hypothetical protein ACHREM_12465 [Polyangiales bacterium]
MTDESDTLFTLLAKERVLELARVNDAREATERALLLAIVLLENDERPAARTLTNFVLAPSSPLSSVFRDHKHALVGDIEVLRSRSHEGDLQLAPPLERVRRRIEARRARGEA